MTVRPMKTEDLDQVMAIENESFSDPWIRSDFEESLAQPDLYVFLVAENDEKELAGFVGLLISGDEADVADVAVKKSERQRGVGRLLLQKALEIARKRGVLRVFLEVRESNAPAITLYEKCGFQAVGVRKRYYQNPPEDGRLMRLSLTEEGVS